MAGASTGLIGHANGHSIFKTAPPNLFEDIEESAEWLNDAAHASVQGGNATLVGVNDTRSARSKRKAEEASTASSAVDFTALPVILRPILLPSKTMLCFVKTRARSLVTRAVQSAITLLRPSETLHVAPMRAD